MIKKYFTGIGSRSTPDKIGYFFSDIAHRLEHMNFILRSGAADGADRAFERGISDINFKEIWLPWKNFNGSKSTLFPSQKAFDLAATIHPVWNNLSKCGQALHARNCHQVLGADLNTPSNFVLCWTENAEVRGGTATAIKLAKRDNIPILNFGKYDKIEAMNDAFEDFLILNGEL